MATIVSINVALPGDVPYDNGHKMRSAINKKPVAGQIYLDDLGFLGDGSADKVHHGGQDKAVCVYCLDHFPYWEKELGTQLSCGAFGENLSVSGLTEKDVHIGDIFRIGDVEVQVTQPRQPCHKLNKAFRYQAMACKVQQTGFSGFYMRVLNPGWMEPGVPFELLRADPGKFSVDAANHLRHHDKENYEKMRDILAVEALSDSWRAAFRKRLEPQHLENSLERSRG